MFSQDRSKHRCQRHQATLHGVVFDILVGSEHRVGLAAVFPDDDRRLACRAVARAQRPAFALRARRRRDRAGRRALGEMAAAELSTAAADRGAACAIEGLHAYRNAWTKAVLERRDGVCPHSVRRIG
jgi:hypothetical protein